jgi:hypothetical protein
MTIQEELVKLFKDKKSTWNQIHDSFEFQIHDDEKDLIPQINQLINKYWGVQ